MFTGSLVALVTPFAPDDTLDRAALSALIDWHVEAGTAGLVIAGTTGESPTLTSDEHAELIAASVEQAAGRIPIVAGTGSNSTAQTIALSQRCEAAGVDGFLLVAPYYNKPTQEGLYQHFSAIADATSKPVILYNVPGRTCSDIEPETVGRLSAHPRIVGIKDATGDLDRLAANLAAAPAPFLHLSGDDLTAREFLLRGGDGVISVTANIAPREMSELCRACRDGDAESAGRIDAGLEPLNHQMFVESNPIPVKWALHIMKKIGPGIRLPLTFLSAKYRQPLVENLIKAGIANDE